MDRGAWWATVHGVAKSQTRLSDFIHTSMNTPKHHSRCLHIQLEEFVSLTERCLGHFQVSPWNTFCYCLVTKLYLTLCEPLDCSMPSSSVLHYLPEVCSESRPLNQWCHPTISSSVTPFSFCLQSFTVSGSYELTLHIRGPKYCP